MKTYTISSVKEFTTCNWSNLMFYVEFELKNGTKSYMKNWVIKISSTKNDLHYTM